MSKELTDPAEINAMIDPTGSLARAGLYNPLPEVMLISDMLSLAKLCPICASIAVVPLTAKQLAAQPDNTTHVCHPALGGCNWGYGP